MFVVTYGGCPALEEPGDFRDLRPGFIHPICLEAIPKSRSPLSDPPMEVSFRGQINPTQLAPPDFGIGSYPFLFILSCLSWRGGPPER
jgi:hypothetical protein